MTWQLWAHHEDNLFRHIGHKRWVELHGLPKIPIVPVTVSVIAEGKGEEEAYYGWQDKGEYDKPPSMIWPHWKSFSICFPYGPQAEAKHDKGRIVRLQVTPGHQP
jgi:hypothetical protein